MFIEVIVRTWKEIENGELYHFRRRLRSERPTTQDIPTNEDIRTISSYEQDKKQGKVFQTRVKTKRKPKKNNDKHKLNF